MQMLYVRPRFVKRLLCVALVLVLVLSITGRVLVRADASPDSSWSSPGAMLVRRISALSSTRSHPTLLENLDCTQMTYRLAGASTMQDGCFTPTAFGMLDSDNEVVIFNGTDEGLPLSPSSAHQVLAPWPAALNLVTLDAADVGGSYVGMYKNPLSLLQDQRNFNGQLTGKKLTGPPEIRLKDPAGQSLRINAQTMAFSSSGSWVVAETMNSSFVRINLATLDIVPFAPAFGAMGSPALLKSQVAVSDDGRFVAIANTVASSFKVYDLNTCTGTSNNLQPLNCRAYDYWSFVGKQIPGLLSVRHVRFVNNNLLQLEATSSNSTAAGVYDLAPTDAITSFTDYLGLGDSYTSGEGAFDYLPGTDTASNKCHLSVHSYPLLLTRDLYSAAGGHSVACSGAVINDIASTSAGYRGQVKNGADFDELTRQPSTLDAIGANFTAGYFAQHRFVQQYQPRVVTVSIGGNDIGFGDLLQKCVEPHVSTHLSDSTCYNTYESRAEVVKLVDRTIPRWTALYKQLGAESPGSQLYAIGYPSIASDTGKCGLNVNLGKSELEFAEELIAYLNSAIQQAASAANVPYVDISKALVGHRLCEAANYDVAVNGLTAGDDNGFLGINVLGRESYHPNRLGHELVEQAILRQTNNLTLKTSATAPTSNQNLLNAPRSGRPINKVVPYSAMTGQVLHTGDVTSLQVSGLSIGLRPNSTYTMRLDGASGSIISTFTSSSTGDIFGNITIPETVLSGSHSIDIIGVNQADEPVDVTQPVYVPANNNDSDGDGIPNGNDSCSYAANSGHDADRDNVDDICDGLIGPPPAPPVTDNNPKITAGTPTNPYGNSTPDPMSITDSATGAQPVVATDQTINMLQHTTQHMTNSASSGRAIASLPPNNKTASRITNDSSRRTGMVLSAVHYRNTAPLLMYRRSHQHHIVLRASVSGSLPRLRHIRYHFQRYKRIVNICWIVFLALIVSLFVSRYRKSFNEK